MTGSDVFEQRRVDLLLALAYAADDPFHAVIGYGHGIELMAVALGVRRHNPMRRGPAIGSVLCFGTREHGNVTLARAYLARNAMIMKQRARRKDGPIPITDVVRFIDGGSDRDGWEEEIAALVRGGPERFGLIVHLGVGHPEEIRADINLMLPMMSDRTELVLCGLDKRHPRSVFKTLARKDGWSGIFRPGIALGELRRLPIA